MVHPAFGEQIRLFFLLSALDDESLIDTVVI